MILRESLGANDLDLGLRKLAARLLEIGWFAPFDRAERYVQEVFRGETETSPEGKRFVAEHAEGLRRANDLLPSNLALLASLALAVGDLEWFETIKPHAWQSMPEGIEWASAERPQ